MENDALNALMALGIPRNTAETALKKAKTGSPDDNLESLIKKSLQLI
jgi:Holliday junction resolvasome RuvABC DNA-binding subunit